MADNLLDYSPARYDDKIDAMRQAEPDWAALSWFEHQQAQDSRNAERLKAYITRRAMRARNEMLDSWLLAR